MSSRPVPDKSKDAALRGAVSAFARPAEEVATSNGAVNAQAAASRAVDTPRRSDPPNPESLPPPRWLNNLQTPLPPRSTSNSRTASPSNLAAVLAVKKLQPRPVSEQVVEDTLPEPGTVTDVKRWLQTLQGYPGADSDDKPRGRRRGSNNKSSELVQADSKGIEDSNPTPIEEAHVLKAQAPPPPLQAPKPQRIVPALISAETDAPESVVDKYTPRPEPLTVLKPSGTITASGTPHQKKSSETAAVKSGQVSPRRVESLANAIVASHLASSRSSSPFKTSAPQKPVETLHAPFHASKRYVAASRTPSPSKGHLYTMRQEPSSSDGDGHSKRRHRKLLGIRKHPHKHHEGDRKRWRDEVTERERRRYEGVWAANRGLHTDQKSCVSNLVVRDIWKRSKLPENTLEEIWALVDRTDSGMLDREEFVVGLWLIDQRLKGRKLPTRIGDSVWLSVHAQGVKVSKP